VALAIVTSQGRGVVVASVCVLLAYAAMTIVSRGLVPTLVGIVAAALVTMAITSAIGAESSSFRYESIAPSKVLASTEEERGGSLAVGLTYLTDYPLGAGLGSVGPSSGVGSSVSSFNGETELSFLAVEVGIIGVIVLIGFQLRLVAMSAVRIRRFIDPELRALLTRVAAALPGVLVLGVGGAPLAGSPGAPYLFFAGGVPRLIGSWTPCGLLGGMLWGHEGARKPQGLPPSSRRESLDNRRHAARGDRGSP